MFYSTASDLSKTKTSNDSDTTKAVVLASALGGAVGALVGATMLKMAEAATDKTEPAAIAAQQQKPSKCVRSQLSGITASLLEIFY